ncbi:MULTISPECIES: fimbrial protein [unclassified Pseudomonas]|uniref:fimbrial protein n=1 Tax=Pseudomonas TaxID=286 RepID=UPI00164515F9|nr:MULTISPECIES: fimbrial protein [unclassified Pseudomonas]MBC3421041.1 fimbrial protein [Pseudomonas sp. RW3S2]MBC3466468.1 fimbrial protein [Pseudomonas sp. RW10S2]QXI43103.1 fimbrial protein [Pseudomonas wayambapalatensis]
MRGIIALCLPVLMCQASLVRADAASELQVTGALVRPLCTTLFPQSQSVSLPAISRNELTAGSSPWTDVPLAFRCADDTRVNLRLVPADAAYDDATLKTTLNGLGLRLRLRDLTSASPTSALRLNEVLAFTVSGGNLQLSLGAKAIKMGDQTPAVGGYQTQLLMVMEYL